MGEWVDVGNYVGVLRRGRLSEDGMKKAWKDSYF